MLGLPRLFWEYDPHEIKIAILPSTEAAVLGSNPASVTMILMSCCRIIVQKCKSLRVDIVGPTAEGKKTILVFLSRTLKHETKCIRNAEAIINSLSESILYIEIRYIKSIFPHCLISNTLLSLKMYVGGSC